MIKVEDKRELILKSIIETYLSDNTPIGSNELNSSLCIPASTIRVYLKKLSDEGLITQIHISSGRIPTILTMQNYWRNELDIDSELDIKNEIFLYHLLKEYKIYCLVYGGRDLVLKEIFNLNDKFIILDFEENEIVLKYNSQGFDFLKTLIGLNLFDLENIVLKVKFVELAQKISNLKQSLVYSKINEQRAYQIYQNDEFAKLLDCTVDRKFSKNLQFEPLFKKGFMGFKINAQFLGKSVNIIFAGSVYTDYNKVLKQIKEAA